MRRGTGRTDDFATEAARWQAVADRDAGADGAFVYAVRTTGVFCRPGCASRRPRRENVVFFATAGEAERAGFAPCKRCRPDGVDPRDTGRAAVVEACRLLDAAEVAPTLEQLAEAVGVSATQLPRLFRRVLGVTPKQYRQSRRAESVRGALGDGRTVTDALYGAGFGSSSRFYEGGAPRLGMKPTQFRAGGAGARIRIATANSSLGRVLVAATERGVCAVEFGDDDAALVASFRARFSRAEIAPADPGFSTWVEAVIAAIDAPDRRRASAADAIPLDLWGTAFQQRVWALLRAIPPGATISYSELARRAGNPRATRAVAGACAANPAAVVVPCHRAVAADGSLAGYRWGIARKRRLLERESGAIARSERTTQSRRRRK